jgi:hypothetical protein
VLVCSLAAEELPGRTADLETLAGELDETYGAQVRVVAILTGAAPLPDLIGVTPLLDDAGAFARACGAAAGYICLVRPDGYLAYAADRPARSAVLAALARGLGAGDPARN